MIYAKIAAGDKSIKGEDTLAPIFNKCDVNNDGMLDWEEWLEFGKCMKQMLTDKYGSSYDLTEE